VNFNKPVLSPIAICIFFAVATSSGLAASVSNGSSEPKDPARQQRISEVRSDLNIKISVSSFDPMVPLLARTVAPTDSTWNPDHPRWTAVCDRITQDLHRDLAAGIAAEQQWMDAKWEAALDQSLTDEDIDHLLAFYRSDVGKRFLEFQKALDPIISSAGTAYLGALSTARAVPESDSVPPSPETTALRRRIYRLSFSNVLASSALRDPGVKEAKDMLEQAALSTQGAALDVIAKRISADLQTFDQFEQSTAVKKIAGAGRSLLAAQGGTSHAGALQEALLAEPSKHAATWQAVYASR
jgi:hypothetical protein